MAGAHSDLACVQCHGKGARTSPPAALADSGRRGCIACHGEYAGVLHGPMAERRAEKDFVAETWGRVDPGFFGSNCGGCHVRGCGECHGGGHAVARPGVDACLACHRGENVGIEFVGLAPREDALRYQRGPEKGGERYLKMLPDVHAEAGMKCGDCHGMASLAGGKGRPRACGECHSPDPRVIEHRIDAHLKRLECYACHSAWAPQEYGTFFVRLRDSEVRRFFRLKTGVGKGDGYVRSAYLRRQNAPPLGLNGAGRVSPIRPRFIAYFTDIQNDRPVGRENRLLTARWQAFFPHTVRRGTALCDGCHGAAARFLLETEKTRIYRPDRDGMGLLSFWVQTGQQVANGAFFDRERFERMSRPDPDYTKGYTEKWKKLAESVGAPSKR